MSFLAGVVGLVGLLFLVVTAVGLIAPSVFKDKKTGDVPKRMHFAVGGTAASFMAFAIAGALLPEAASDKDAQEAVQVRTNTPLVPVEKRVIEKPAVASIQPDESLGISPEEFRLNFNQIISQVDSDYKLAELDIEAGAVNDVFKRSLGSNIALIGSVNKGDGSLRQLMVVIAGATPESDPVKPIAVLLTAAQAVNQKTPKEENSKAVVEMATLAMKNIETGKAIERNIGELRYTASASSLTGLMFAISHP